MVRRREPVVHYGPGFHRMKTRLGPEAMEAMRRDVIERQLAARSMISGERVTERDRDTYKEYPTPRQRSITRMVEETMGKVDGTIEPHTGRKTKSKRHK